MKQKLKLVLAALVLTTGAFAQNEKKPTLIGIHFNALDFKTPETFKKWLDDYYKRVNKKILPEVGYWYHIYGRGIYKCVSNELDWFTFINHAGGVFVENYDFDFSNFKLMDYKPYNKN